MSTPPITLIVMSTVLTLNCGAKDTDPEAKPALKGADIQLQMGEVDSFEYGCPTDWKIKFLQENRSHSTARAIQ
ncbi:MAG: hypothetical protein JKY56_16145 [Kofleriaceae bacterium]|nr:hypothetical protein [Kofleriaceae bacterium]